MASTNSVIWNRFLCPGSLHLPLGYPPWYYHNVVVLEFKFFCWGSLKWNHSKTRECLHMTCTLLRTLGTPTLRPNEGPRTRQTPHLWRLSSFWASLCCSKPLWITWMFQNAIKSALPVAFRGQAIEGMIFFYFCYLSRGKSPPLHRVGLLLPNCIGSWGEGNWPLLAVRLECYPKQ